MRWAAAAVRQTSGFHPSIDLRYESVDLID